MISEQGLPLKFLHLVASRMALATHLLSRASQVLRRRKSIPFQVAVRPLAAMFSGTLNRVVNHIVSLSNKQKLINLNDHNTNYNHIYSGRVGV